MNLNNGTTFRLLTSFILPPKLTNFSNILTKFSLYFYAIIKVGVFPCEFFSVKFIPKDIK